MDRLICGSYALVFLDQELPIWECNLSHVTILLPFGVDCISVATVGYGMDNIQTA